MERRKFEDTFKEAFQGAEAEPTENVWTNLELDLEKEESSRMKRRLLFYQMVAAASITFAIVMAGIGYYAITTRTDSDAPMQLAASADLNAPESVDTEATTGTKIPKGTDGNNPEDPSFTNQHPSNQPMNVDNADRHKIQQGQPEAQSGNKPAAELLADNRLNPSSSQSVANNGNVTSSSAVVTSSSRTSKSGAAGITGISGNRPVANVQNTATAGNTDNATSASVYSNNLAGNANNQTIANAQNASPGNGSEVKNRPGESENYNKEGTASQERYSPADTGDDSKIVSDKQSITRQLADNMRTGNMAGTNSLIPGNLGASDATASSNQPVGSNVLMASALTDNTKSSAEKSITATGRPLPALVPQRQITLTMAQEPQPDPVAQMFARLEQRERELREEGDEKKKDRKDKSADRSEKLWTSAGFAAGSFTNVNSGVNTPTSNNALSSSYNRLASQQVNAAGTSYSVGVGMGTKLSDRWIVQGGFNYQTQMYNYTSDKAVGDSFSALMPASVSTLDKANYTADARAQTMLVSTAPYRVNNDSRFVSVPVQAGYLLVNKRTAVQLNAGVSTDLFLQNTNGSAGNLGMTTERLGDNTTYRSVNFSGLIGTELSYKIAPRYRLALSPGMRYAFNSIFKSSTGVQAMPLTFDVGLRFRYIFH